MCHGRRWMPHPQRQDTSEEGRGRKLFVLVSMLLGVIHTGLKQNFKGQFCLLSDALLAPAFMTLCRQRKGQRPSEKPIPNRLFPAVKWSQGLTFCWIHSKEGAIYIGLFPKYDLSLFFSSGKFPSGEFLGSWNPREHIICNTTLNGSKVVFLPVQEVWITPPVDPEKKNKTKQNLEK